MRVNIKPSTPHGSVCAPPSKSMAHRMLICAGLAHKSEPSLIFGLEDSQDILATIDCLNVLGAGINRQNDCAAIYGIDSSAVRENNVLPCRECGSTLRFFVPLCLLQDKPLTLTGSPTLMSRPMDVYRAICQQQGLLFSQDEQGIHVQGPLRAGTFTIPGNISSQFISGLLFATPLMESESSIEVLAPYESHSYVDMTVDAMQQFGVKVASRARKNGSMMYRVAAPQRYTACDFAVEGDYSQAAFLAVLGCVIGGITITGLNPDSQQGDKVILDILKRCGGKFKAVEGGFHFDRSLLKATDIDLADCPDLGPILFTLGCFCSGETVIRNAGRLRLKESDRIEAMQTELQKMGARIDVDGDTVHIQGVALHAPNAPLSGHNDHRIVMALAVAAIASGLPALLCGAEAVEKSWPAFWNVLRGLGAKIELSTDKQDEFDIKA